MQTQPDELEYVGFWARFGAFLIDNILLSVLMVLILSPFYAALRWIGGLPTVLNAIGFVLIFFPIVTTVLACVSKRTTPGKRVISAKIIDVRTGDTPSVGQLVGRYLAYIISTLPFWLGFIWAAFDDRKQGWHDKLAGTVVVRQKKGTTEKGAAEKETDGATEEGTTKDS